MSRPLARHSRIASLPRNERSAHRRLFWKLIALALLLGGASGAFAAIYKYTDADGRTVYAGQPPEGVAAEKLDIRPNTVEIRTPPPPPPTPVDNSQSPAPAYRSLRLDGLPREGAAIRANDGVISFSVVLDPALQPGHVVQVVLDGQAYGTAARQTQWTLSGVSRGEHSIAVDVQAGGAVVQRSDTYTFTVQRVSLNSPARAP